MKTNQLFPFERNRYYSGKLLTSSDFEAEQTYMNGKRHFLNHIMFGKGIVCGLGVSSIDGMSIRIQSGVAIDEHGHEIVVPSTVVKRLSVMEGYEKLASENVGLFIRYREEAVHSVYCGDMGGNGNEYENNRIDEEYEFYLKDITSSDYSYQLENGVIHNEKILDNEDYTILIRAPHTVAKDKSFKIEINIRKNSNIDKILNFRTKLQLPAFIDYEGQHELDINIENISLSKDNTVSKEYWVGTSLTNAKEANILARKEDTKISIGGYDIESQEGINFMVLMSGLSPDELSMCEVCSKDLENVMKYRNDDGVCIAMLSLIRTDINSIISEVSEQGIKRYIKAPSSAYERLEYLGYFKDKDETGHTFTGDNVALGSRTGDVELPLMMTSGRLEIPLDVNMKKGDVCYSEEIMHGLGKGNVYVGVGIEYIDDDPHNKSNSRNTIYGNPSLFDFPECMEAETAVRVLNDKGSFQVAVKLLGEQKSIVIQLNWVAIKFTSAKDESEMQDEDDRSIIPETPTIRIKAKESYYFNVNFNNMKPCRLSYELTEAGSGEIGADGMYTAPSKEGVYEIYIYCTDMPKISTYVYAIVSK